MAISIEVYTLINFAMNTIIIGAIARSRGRIRWGYVLGAALFGALYALAARSGVFPQLNGWPCQLGLAVLMSFVGLPIESAMELVTGTLMLIAGTVFLGGAQMLVIRLMGGQTPWSMAVGALGGGLALVKLLEARMRRLERLEAHVFIGFRGASARVTALIDTGNRLHEPLSGLPVLIVEANRVRKLLPAALDPAAPEHTIPGGFRLVAYGALGGRGQMACFLPDELLVSYGDGWMSAPDVWVAVYPAKMPGAAHALAPTVLGRIGPARKIKRNERSRYRWSMPHSRS